MDNQSKERNFVKVNNQLTLLEERRKDLLKDLYNSYEIYLESIRTEMFNSVCEGIITIFGILNKGNYINNENITKFINVEIENLIQGFLPFITIEQLVILEKNFHKKKEFNEVIDKFNLKYNYGKNEITSIFENTEDLHEFSYSYYDSFSRENSIGSVDLDNNSFDDNFKFGSKSFDNFVERQLEFNFTENSYIKRESIDKDFSYKNINTFQKEDSSNILDWAESIDNGLSFQLKEMSIEINKKIFKEVFKKDILPENLLFYLFENTFLTTNPNPYIILFDLLSNEYLYNYDYFKGLNFSKVYLFSINIIELEFNNIKLNILRTKITKLKRKLKTLIKKEKYWNDKKLFFKYNSSKTFRN